MEAILKISKKPRIAIINRSFWPVYPVIGEALLSLAEELSRKQYRVSVIMQDHSDVKKHLAKERRGHEVDLHPAKAFSHSGNSELHHLNSVLLNFAKL